MLDAFAKNILIAALLTGCRSIPAPTTSPSNDALLQFNYLSNRLIANHLESGWVVSKENKEPRHTGDSLLWSGVALGGLDCLNGDAILANLLEVIESSGGRLQRYKDVRKGDEISFDGETGFMYGWVLRALRCPQNFMAMKNAWNLRQDFVAKQGGYLYPGSKARIPYIFSFTVKAVNYFFNAENPPKSTDLDLMAKGASGWALATKMAKKSCFRTHLAWLHLKTVEALGFHISRPDKADFCEITKDTGLPVIDGWCSRPGLKEYMDSFSLNEWEYRHQRCSAWETPDGKGYETPALDYLVGFRQLYNTEDTP